MAEVKKCYASKDGMIRSGVVDPKDIEAVLQSECGKPAKFRLSPTVIVPQYAGDERGAFYLCDEHVKPWKTIDQIEIVAL